MTRGRSQRVLVRHWDGSEEHRRPDELVVEEPLTVELDSCDCDHHHAHSQATTSSWPRGSASPKGLLGDASVTSIRYCATEPAADTEFNLVTVETDGAPPATPRLGLTTSSCGLCGAESIELLRERLSPLPPSETPISTDVLAEVPERVRAFQDLFGATGGVHAAAAFTVDGQPTLVREDIGRHNAVDKVVGRLLLDDDLPASGQGLFVSGRASFEMVQKAWAAGFAVLVAVSAPSALAVETAAAAGLGLAGFVRDGQLNFYFPSG